MSLGADLLRDRRIRLSTLVTLDPPPSATAARVGRLALTVTGARVRASGPDHLVLRAWAPTPAFHVAEPGDRDRLTVRLENVPVRVRLRASGPVEEERDGPNRTLRFSPRETRDVGFTTPDHDVTFAALGDTGDSLTFSEALRVAAGKGADFFLLAGDVVYEDKEIPNIREILDTAPLPVFVVRGNHDYRNRARIAFLRALAPAYYAFHMGGATFVVLDNAGDYLPGFWRRSTQYRWWLDRLAEPRNGPLFIVMHKPPFDRRTGPKRAPMLDKPFAHALMRDFTRAGVAAVLTGHVHDTFRWVAEGIPYIVSGEGLSPFGIERSRMTWAEVRGWDVRVEQVPIWRRGLR